MNAHSFGGSKHSHVTLDNDRHYRTDGTFNYIMMIIIVNINEKDGKPNRAFFVYYDNLIIFVASYPVDFEYYRP